jgi:hypothetical protein
VLYARPLQGKIEPCFLVTFDSNRIQTLDGPSQLAQQFDKTQQFGKGGWCPLD